MEKIKDSDQSFTGPTKFTLDDYIKSARRLGQQLLWDIPEKDTTEWKIDKGISLNLQEKHEEALSFWNRYLMLEPEYPELWYNKGVTLHAQERYEEAIACYDDAIKKQEMRTHTHGSSIHVSPYYGKGLSLAKLERYEEAIACYDDAIKLYPKSSRSWDYRGFSLHFLPASGAGMICYDEAIKLDPKFSFAWNNKGVSLKKLGRDEEAEQCLVKSRELQQC